MTTAQLALPYVAGGQAGYTNHNKALDVIDALLAGGAILDRDLTAPPAAPLLGDAYIPKATATGAWAGLEGRILVYLNTGWYSVTPKEGQLLWVRDEDRPIIYDGAVWIEYQPRSVLSYCQINTGGFERWYEAGRLLALANTNNTPNIDTIYAIPQVWQSNRTIDGFAIEVLTGSGSGGSVARLGVYEATSLVNLYPAARVFDIGTSMATDSTGFKTVTGLSFKPIPGKLYWVAFNCNGGAPQLRAVGGGALPCILGMPNTGGSGAGGTGWSVASTFAAPLPSTFPGGGAVEIGTRPSLFFRHSA